MRLVRQEEKTLDRDMNIGRSNVWTHIHTDALPQGDFLHSFHNKIFLQTKFADVRKQQRHSDTWNNIQLNVRRRYQMVTTEQVDEKEK